ncbi:TIGR02444 family protein [Aliikangiella coralliicola]|uniref:TIGR02444 family protein n=1 Tax=Aliikangiella coralliicola TaxID=2592383 RepID=A0A545UI84_9GAMM|nr:TIGR02444 family protein [Aliikangiella coralliicola]TQV89143.1 TIGR02444 family protein [Aliikangiella coralliicola]
MSNLELSKKVADFWQRSTSFYSIAAVRELLLQLQNDHQKNINRLLFALWFSSEERRYLSQNETRAIKHSVQPVESWIIQARKIRFEIKAQQETIENYPSIREGLLASELALEKLHQQRILQGVYELVEDIKSPINQTNAPEVMLGNIHRMCGQTQEAENLYLQLIQLWQDFEN